MSLKENCCKIKLEGTAQAKTKFYEGVFYTAQATIIQNLLNKKNLVKRFKVRVKNYIFLR
jgi:hypothetical protein